jgi:hypothetical protein
MLGRNISSWPDFGPTKGITNDIQITAFCTGDEVVLVMTKLGLRPGVGVFLLSSNIAE